MFEAVIGLVLWVGLLIYLLHETVGTGQAMLLAAVSVVIAIAVALAAGGYELHRRIKARPTAGAPR